MKTIHKVALFAVQSQKVDLPEGAVFLSAQVQREMICLWYIFDDDKQGSRWRTVMIFATGDDAARAEGLRFLDTVQLERGSLVFHVFVED